MLSTGILRSPIFLASLGAHVAARPPESTRGAATRMSKKHLRIGDELQAWITARKRHGLSHAHVQMARELGMNPKKLGKLDNVDQEPWKLRLPAFIESFYRKRFAKDGPDTLHSMRNAPILWNKRRPDATLDGCSAKDLA